MYILVYRSDSHLDHTATVDIIKRGCSDWLILKVWVSAGRTPGYSNLPRDVPHAACQQKMYLILQIKTIGPLRYEAVAWL
jgi:hypothetical protein